MAERFCLAVLATEPACSHSHVISASTLALGDAGDYNVWLQKVHHVIAKHQGYYNSNGKACGSSILAPGLHCGTVCAGL